jgi:hypothetical protein
VIARRVADRADEVRLQHLHARGVLEVRREHVLHEHFRVARLDPEFSYRDPL